MTKKGYQIFGEEKLHSRRQHPGYAYVWNLRSLVSLLRESTWPGALSLFQHLLSATRLLH